MDRLRQEMEKTEDFQTAANVFRQLADANRVRIFWMLCHCEECVTDISAMVGMSSPAVSHHLQQLKSGGLITSRRDGKEVYYKAADTEESRLLHQTIEKIIDITCPERK
ncbi:MAG: metalloregulator ArsR/SmtB family transcription factor [Lachnospiraceae bacterium]|nr:metalloregulator ArsR/SmtB family transcription factor [Lachnospiraceae bacterium]